MTLLSQKAICLLLAVQVGMVGALGTGLHSLLGCSHGAQAADGSYACSGHGSETGCNCKCDSAFERLRRAKRHAEVTAAQPVSARSVAAFTSQSVADDCHGHCSLCDLIKQYHNAARAASASVLFSSEALDDRPLEVELVDANESTRLADSRGPPTFSLS